MVFFLVGSRASQTQCCCHFTQDHSWSQELSWALGKCLAASLAPTQEIPTPTQEAPLLPVVTIQNVSRYCQIVSKWAIEDHCAYISRCADFLPAIVTESPWRASQVVLVVTKLSANADARDMGLIPGLGRYPGEGNGNPL